MRVPSDVQRTSAVDPWAETRLAASCNGVPVPSAHPGERGQGDEDRFARHLARQRGHLRPAGEGRALRGPQHGRCRASQPCSPCSAATHSFVGRGVGAGRPARQSYACTRGRAQHAVHAQFEAAPYERHALHPQPGHHRGARGEDRAVPGRRPAPGAVRCGTGAQRVDADAGAGGGAAVRVAYPHGEVVVGDVGARGRAGAGRVGEAGVERVRRARPSRPRAAARGRCRGCAAVRGRRAPVVWTSSPGGGQRDARGRGPRSGAASSRAVHSGSSAGTSSGSRPFEAQYGEAGPGVVLEGRLVRAVPAEGQQPVRASARPGRGSSAARR